MNNNSIPKTEFYTQLEKHDWLQIADNINKKTSKDVELALNKSQRNLEDFKALISPAAIPYLETMAQKSRETTLKRFGKTILLYLPLYLSNYCQNHCVYCGFNTKNKIERIILSKEQILKEVKAIKAMGYEHILLVTGESTKAGIDYFKNVFNLIHPYFSLISIEIQPLEQNEYKELIKLGLNTVYLYQETYHIKNYPLYHLAGKKSIMNYRLDAYERMGRAGIHRMGLGVLLGLENWRVDSFFTAMHLRYLQRKFWKTKFCISFPRLRPHAGSFQPNFHISDRELLQLITAYRLFDEDVEMSLSTREKPEYRDNMLKLGITAMSAGSKTKPGGYAQDNNDLEQFTPGDNRSPQEVMKIIKEKGYEVVWKDWDYFMQTQKM